MSSDDIVKKIKKDGWYLVNTVGSHMQFRHPVKKGRVTVPEGRKDVPIGIVISIEKQSGLKLR